MTNKSYRFVAVRRKAIGGEVFVGYMAILIRYRWAVLPATIQPPPEATPSSSLVKCFLAVGT